MIYCHDCGRTLAIGEVVRGAPLKRLKDEPQEDFDARSRGVTPTEPSGWTFEPVVTLQLADGMMIAFDVG